MKPAKLRPLAEEDLVDAAHHYAQAGGKALGERMFVAALAGLKPIQRMPAMGSPRLGQLCAIPGERGFRLSQRFAVGAGIDLKEQRVFDDVLAFGEVDLEDLAGDLRFHLHGFRGVGRADYADLERNCFPSCGGNSDGNRRRALIGGNRRSLRFAAGEEGQSDERKYSDRVFVGGNHLLSSSVPPLDRCG